MIPPSDSRAALAPPKWVNDLAHPANVFPLCFLLVLLVFAAFYPVVLNGFNHYDDQLYVTENRAVQHGLSIAGINYAMTAIVSGNWHPITILSHELDCELFGPKAWGHHLTNLLLHAANTALLFIVLRRFTGAAGRSLIVAALFALHPLRVESVAWVAERKDVLSALFWLLTMWSYLDYVAETKIQGRNAKLYYGRALLFFVLGLMSKPMLVTLPFALLLLDYWPLGRISNLKSQISNPPTDNTSTAAQKSFLNLLLEKIPFLLLAAASCVVTYYVQKKDGAMSTVQPFNIRFANALVSYSRYLGKEFWPVNLCACYPYPDHWPMLAVVLSGLMLVAVTILVIAARNRWPYLPVGWFWFVGTLVPVIGLVQVGVQAMADRYTYIPSIGLLIMLVWGLHDLTRPWREQAAISVAACAVVLLACLGATHHQIKYWSNDETLFRRMIAVTKDNAVAHNNLAAALFGLGRLDDAIPELEEANRIYPLSWNTHNNLGIALRNKNRLDDAIAQYHLALKLAPQNASIHNNLGIAFNAKGQTDAAITEFQTAIHLDPTLADPHCYLADVLLAQGKVEESISEYQVALALNPHFDLATKGLANAMSQRNGKQP